MDKHNGAPTKENQYGMFGTIKIRNYNQVKEHVL